MASNNNNNTPPILLNNYIVVNEFSEYGVKQFKNDFEALKNAPDVPVILIYIDSYGGEIYSLLAMIDMIESCDTKPVATIALGKAMSCGGVLLTCGTKGYRFAGKNSTIMIHGASSFSFGKLEDIKADVNECERLNAVILKILAKKCSQKETYFKKLIDKNKNTNIYLDAESAKKHRIIDCIGIPEVNVRYNLGITQIADESVSDKKD